MNRESRLRSFLATPEGTSLVSYDEVRGFIFAVAGAPELVPPSDWLPEAFNGELPEFETEEQARAILEELMDAYNAALAGGRRTIGQAPTFRKETIANLEENAAVSHWSRGFLRGYFWLQEVWDDSTPEELQEELASILVVLSFFASRRTAEAFREETAGGKTMDEIAGIMRQTFKDAMVEYIRLGKSVYADQLRRAGASAAPEAKVGRNEPCPCGSGKKYKRCCGASSN